MKTDLIEQPEVTNMREEIQGIFSEGLGIHKRILFPDPNHPGMEEYFRALESSRDIDPQPAKGIMA